MVQQEKCRWYCSFRTRANIVSSEGSRAVLYFKVTCVIVSNSWDIACSLTVSVSLPQLSIQHRRAQFVEQGLFYKLCPTTDGLNACWQLTAQQWVASGGRNFSIFSVLIRKLTSRRIPPENKFVRVHSMGAGGTCCGEHTILLLLWRLAVGIARPAVGSKVEGPRI